LFPTTANLIADQAIQLAVEQFSFTQRLTIVHNLCSDLCACGEHARLIGVNVHRKGVKDTAMPARKGSDRPRIPLYPAQREQLARDLGVNKNTVSQWLAGSRRPSFDSALAVLRHPFVAPYALTLEDLMGQDIPPDVRIWAHDDDDRLAERCALATTREETADAA